MTLNRLLGMLGRVVTLLGLAAEIAAAQSTIAPSFEIVPRVLRAMVGDSIPLDLTLRISERDMLLDTVPQAATTLPEGVRILSVEKLARGPDRNFRGRAVMTFYRPGRQTVPSFALPYRRGVVLLHGAAVSEPVEIEIVPALPAGNPPLKDVKEIERIGGIDPVVLGSILAAAALLGVFVALQRRRRPAPAPSEPAVELAAVVLGPYEIALARLTQIEHEHWPARADIARHYAAVTDVVRRYLEEAHSVPALERTTSELAWALPPTLSGHGLREECLDLLGEADLVKFARARPSEASAAGFAREARRLLGRWHRATPELEQTDAIR